MCLNAAVYWLGFFHMKKALDFGATPVLFIFLSEAYQFFFTTSDSIMLCGSLPFLLGIGVVYLLYRIVSKFPFYLIIRTHLDLLYSIC